MAVVISDRLLESTDRLLDAEPDAKLVGRVQSGHDAAFAAIVRRYERELQAQARRLTSDGRAEDAVQQAFLNAFAALRGGREVRHLRGWLHQILRNEIIRARVPLDVPLEAAAAYSEPLEDTVQRRATARATLAELSALPDRQRDALLGTAVFGFPRAHVARSMGLSEGAVRQLVHRARLRLRQAATAFFPFPLVRFFGAARSSVDATPDAALGAGTAVSGGLAIKVGALLASGVVATGIVVTHTFPARHHAAAPARNLRHHISHARTPARSAPASAMSAAPSAAASLTNAARLREHSPAGTLEDGRFTGGPRGLSGTRSGRHGGHGTGRGATSGRGSEGSSPGRGDNGSGGLQRGTSGGRRDGDGSGSPSGTGSGVRSGSGSGAGAGSGDHGSGSGSGSGSSGGGDSGSVTGTAGSGSPEGTGTSGGGHGSPGSSGDDGGSLSSDASTVAPTGSSGSASIVSTTATTSPASGDDGGSSGGGSSDGGSSGSTSDGGSGSGGKN